MLSQAFESEPLPAPKLPEAFAFDSPDISAPVLSPAFAPEPLSSAKLPEAFASSPLPAAELPQAFAESVQTFSESMPPPQAILFDLT